MSATLKLANGYLAPNYGVLKLEIISGKGAYVWARDDNGKKKKCLDLLCGLGVTSLGHCHPAIVSAIEKQVKILMHVSNLYATGPMAELAWRLAEASGFGEAKVFFCNSGTEANEAAGKLARIWAHENFGEGKNKIIALKNSFHGRTFLSISLTGQSKMQDKFAPVVPGVEFVEMNDIDGLNKVVDDKVCAVIFETIQAEGGVNVMSEEFYHEINRLSRVYNFLRIVDEVQTGIGRTGKMFSWEHFGGRSDDGPDIITLAKALGGGLPMGAIIAKGQVGQFLLVGSHAATFGGNPVVCAAASAVLKTIYQKNLLINVTSLGNYLIDSLKYSMSKYSSKIKEVRGRGFMVGVELQKEYLASSVIAEMRNKGVFLGTAGAQVVRFLPPFIIDEEEISGAVTKFEEVIKKI